MSKRIAMLRGFAAMAAALACAGAPAQTALSLGAPPGDAKRGSQVYMKQLFYTCHGTIGQGGESGAATTLYPNPYPFQAFVAQVRKPRQSMPPYTDKHVSDQDLADIY